MSEPRIYYYESKHMFECGRDTYYNVIPEHNIQFKDEIETRSLVWDEMVWDSWSNYSYNTHKMVSFAESDRINELIEIIKLNNKKEENRKEMVRMMEYREEKRKAQDEYDRRKGERRQRERENGYYW